MVCSKCKQTGHNARSCKNEIINEEVSHVDVDVDSDIKEVNKKEKITNYYCYFLGQHNNWNGQTYNGYTTNLKRRLRQHNGEIKGGAWATTSKENGAWSFIAVMTSKSWQSISRAMACEWNCRYPTRKKPRPKIYAGSSGRINSLTEIFTHIKDDISLYVHPEFHAQVVGLNIPEHVTIYQSLDELN